MKITEQDFINKVDRHACNGKIVENGRAKEGHENCYGCQGNYLYGGECNFGGEHTIAHDLNIINQNFNRFDLLAKRQDNLSNAVSEKDFNQEKKKLIDDYQYLIRKCEADKLDFFTGTCISIESKQNVFLEAVKQSLRLQARQIKFFVEEAQDLDWWKLKNYRDKTKKLEKLGKEATQTAVDYKAAVERGDTAEATRLLGILKQQESAINQLKLEIERDPVNKLLGEKTQKAFKNVISAIWGKNNDNLLDWLEENKKKKKEQITEKKVWGFIPQRHWKKVKWGGTILFLGVILWLFFCWIYEKIK